MPELGSYGSRYRADRRWCSVYSLAEAAIQTVPGNPLASWLVANRGPARAARTTPTAGQRHARGRRWLDEIVSGSVTSVDEIALRERCSLRHVNMTISLAFLAPKLVRAAVEGRLPRGVNIARLCSGRMVSPVRSARFDATAITYARKSAVVNAPGMAPLNKAASAGESLVRQERDFWMRRPGPRNRRKRQRTSAETKTAQNR